MDKKLLDEVIWRYKNPSHRGVSDGVKCNAKNLSCGDDITLYVDVDDGVVRAASYAGEACAICNYGADLLCEKIVGMGVDDAREVSSAELLGESSLLQNPVRLKCFELAQKALEKLS